MAGFEEAIERLRNDPAFADAVRTDAAHALVDFHLDARDLARVERLVDPASHPSPKLFRRSPSTTPDSKDPS